MRKLSLLAALAFFATTVQCQNNILFTAGISYTNGPPTFSPGGTGARIAVDFNAKKLYYNTTGSSWELYGEAIQSINVCTPPPYVPAGFQSTVVVNSCDSLYLYRGGAWRHLNPAGSGGGTVTTDATLAGDGSSGTPLKIAQQAATSGQVLKWNGTTWLPAADGGTTYTGGTGIDVTGTVISNTGDLSATNELQNLSLTGQALGISGGSGVTLPIIDVTAGRGILVTKTSGSASVAVDTALVPTLYGTQSLYKLWPKGEVNSYQPVITKRNWKIFYNSIQSSSSTNSYMMFDTITSSLGSTTNFLGNGIWMATTGGSGQCIAGFSNHLQAGLGFNYMASGSILFTDWRQNSTRGSILKALNWSGGGAGDMGITLYTSRGFVTAGTTKTVAGDEIGAIRFVSADTTAALNSTTKTFTMNSPCAAIVGYNFKTPFINAYYGGIGLWTTNGSLTQVRAVAVDSTFSTTVRAGINVVPSPANALQVAGKTSIAGNLELSTAGNKILIATGANASAGTATLVGGTVTVSNTNVTSSSIFYVTCKTPIVTQGQYSVPTIVNGTSFTINSTSVADNSVVFWQFIN